MKKIKLITFVILVFGSLYWLVNMYSIPSEFTVIFDDVIQNETIRSELNFSFTFGMEHREQKDWNVRNGEVRVGSINEEELDTTPKPYFPYSNLAYPLSYDFSDFIISDTLDVDFSVELEPAGMGTHWVYAYPKQVNFSLFNEFETDLTLPIENNEIVCVAKIKNNQEVPTDFNDCRGEAYEFWLQNRSDRTNIVFAETENNIYWSLSGTDGFEGTNHLYKCEKGRFDKSVEISSWDNQDKTVVTVAYENDNIVLICLDQIEEYDKEGRFINGYIFTPHEGLPIAEIKDRELIIKYYNAKDYPTYYNYEDDFEIQAIQSVDLDTQTVYDYNLIPIRDIKSNVAVQYKKGRIYLLINEENAIRIEVYEDYEKIYEGIVRHDETIVKGMQFTNAMWR